MVMGCNSNDGHIYIYYIIIYKHFPSTLKYLSLYISVYGKSKKPTEPKRNESSNL